MGSFKIFQSWLVIAALAALAALTALLISPATRWIVVAQSEVLSKSWVLGENELPKVPAFVSVPNIFNTSAGLTRKNPKWYDRSLSRVIEQHQNDVQLQSACIFARATLPYPWKNYPPWKISGPHYNWPHKLKLPISTSWTPPNIPTPTLQALRELLKRFPQNPSLIAATLSFAAPDQVEPEWGRTQPVNDDIEEPITTLGPGPNRRWLDWLNRLAAKGEKLDPVNALYPAMRAAILFTFHRDTAAAKMLLRVSKCSQWDSGRQYILRGETRLAYAAFGKRSIVAALSTLTSGLDLGSDDAIILRSTARMGVSEAILAQRNGDLKNSIAIRHAVFNLGRLMCIRSHRLLDIMVGWAISGIALSEPDGHYHPSPIKISGMAHSKLLAVQYTGYLRKMGYPVEAAWVEHESAAVDKLNSQIVQIFRKHNLVGMETLLNLMFLWTAGGIIIGMAIWLLILGGAAALLTRLRSARGDRPIRSVVYLVGLIYIASFFLPQIPLVSTVVGSIEVVIVLWFLLALVIGAIGAFICKHPLLQDTGLLLLDVTFIEIAIGLFLLSLAIIAFIVYLAIAGYFAKFQLSIGLVLFYFVATVIPFAMFLWNTIASWRKRTSFTVGQINGLRQFALPLACLLILCYGGSVLITQQHERRARIQFNQILTNETRFYLTHFGRG